MKRSILTFVICIVMLSCSKNNSVNNPTAQIPVLTTAVVSSIAETTAMCGGNVTSDGGAAVTERGVCWSTGQTPTTADSKTFDGTGEGSFISSVAGLKLGVKYYLRAYATNSNGTGYGNPVSFTTQSVVVEFNPNLTYGTMTDIDGNVYKTIQIDNQVWMAENLKTMKYNDGTAIPLVTDSTAWSSILTPGYCWYGNDSVTHENPYGALYTWYAVNTGKLSPTGWHVPTDAEWTTLKTYLGGENVAGGKMKEAGTGHWLSPNTGADNSSGFTTLPGGSRFYDGSFLGMGYFGYWWSSTENSSSCAWQRSLSYNVAGVGHSSLHSKLNGYSVRCVRD